MRFIGCKENLLPFIESHVKQKSLTGGVFCDLFAGTGSVGKRFKQLGYRVVANDLLYFSYVLQNVYLTLNEYPRFEGVVGRSKSAGKAALFGQDGAQAAINILNKAPGREGFIYKNYSAEGTKNAEHRRMYFTGENAKKIDGIRETIEEWKGKKRITEQEYYFLLCALIEAAPGVANISGTYAAFLKTWDKRAHKPLVLQPPRIGASNREHSAYNADGAEIVENLGPIDLLYLDPPYNGRQYASNYHILETIARWDNPAISGKTGMRDYQGQKSAFCNRASGLRALESILQKANFKHLLLSYSDEGIIPQNDIVRLFERYGKLEIKERPYQRYKSHSNGNGKNGVYEKLYWLKQVNSKNTLNDMSGAEWLYFLNSVEVTNYPTSGKESHAHHIRKRHPSPKPPQLMQKFIEFFTKEGQTVFDPFMGVGGALLACSLCNRKGVGVDLSKDYVRLYKEACKELRLKEQKAIVGDSLRLEKLLPKSARFDFILTDPPYGDMLSHKRTGERKKKNGEATATPFTASAADLGNMSRESFFESLTQIIADSCERLKPKGYLAVFVKDLQPKNKQLNMLHCQVAERLLAIPALSYRGLKIWHDKTQKLYPFGYPHAFVANQFHQYILIFRKEE